MSDSLNSRTGTGIGRWYCHRNGVTYDCEELIDQLERAEGLLRQIQKSDGEDMSLENLDAIDAFLLAAIERDVREVADKLAADRDYSRGQAVEDLRAILDPPT